MTRDLILDCSGIKPYLWSLSTGKLKSDDILKFWVTGNLIAWTTTSVGQELARAYIQTTLFEYTTFPTKTITITNNGTCSYSEADDSSGPIVKIADVADKSIAQGNLGELSSDWVLLQNPDKDLVKLARLFPNRSAVLTNDFKLKSFLFDWEQTLAYGSASMLAGMVISGTINYQRATRIYTDWYIQDPKWIPFSQRKAVTFKDVLTLEKVRDRENNSFWSSKWGGDIYGK